MDIRDVTSDDLDTVLDLRIRAFGPIPAAERERWRRAALPALTEGRYVGVFDGLRLVAAARLRPFTQWWHGKPQPMAGVAAVTVNPEDRGKGVGGRLMRATVERAVALGDAVSALYPATTPLYRSAGYEHAGARHRVKLRAESLRTIPSSGEVKLRRMGPGDAAELVSVLRRVHGAARASGPVSWDERTWVRLLEAEDDFLYLAPDGYVVYRWDGQDIEVDNLVAGSEETSRALWSLVGSASSMAEHVTASVAPDDPVLWLLRERSTEQAELVRWMSRVLDVGAAVERRGYPAVVAGDAVVEVADRLRPGNMGRWRLEFSGGAGAATPLGDSAESGPVLSINGFSALYAGIPAATLRRSGLMSGHERYDELLDTAFAAKPYMLDYF
ncbi:GNAT family N-acetyltransferase [Nonomuraea sp. NPDC049141]|uniref:GNAT family N-acetyltransferase n=1 Tax=Nonomuraea sp. NPDC049141 TaxID=3155500 RepID=UPI003402DE7C